MSTAEPQTGATFPTTMAFRRTWRTYQARVLAQMGSYLEDRRLHLVAAPGSGKTVLGLEIIRRIDQPTLVLAPTITIRNQWIERLLELFLPDGTMPDWISTDLRKPDVFTVSTYQALHALYSGGGESESAEEEKAEGDAIVESKVEENGQGEHQPCEVAALPEALRNAKFRTLVVDEAHHLRSEWWKTLTAFSEQLDHPTIVALTATPPYDVSFFEWQRYEQLCGPVDAEVSVPELVLQGDLCPHQDYVYFSVPAPQEQKPLTDFRQAVDSFVASLKQNRPFAAAITDHPWIVSPKDNTEEILEMPEYLSSMAVFLNAGGVTSHRTCCVPLACRAKPFRPSIWSGWKFF
jgi:superfamily II DNA or RNA helicase